MMQRDIRNNGGGFTLVEVLLASLTLMVALAAILGAYLGQQILNEHARNLSRATHDANRIIEQMRLQNTGGACALNIIPPGQANWDAWLQLNGGAKSIQPNPATNELIVVSCQDRTAARHCWAAQTGGSTYIPSTGLVSTSNEDPLRITVSVCWRARNRTIGECTVNGGTLTPQDGSNGPNPTAGVIDSPASLTTLITCR